MQVGDAPVNGIKFPLVKKIDFLSGFVDVLAVVVMSGDSLIDQSALATSSRNHVGKHGRFEGRKNR